MKPITKEYLEKEIKRAKAQGKDTSKLEEKLKNWDNEEHHIPMGEMKVIKKKNKITVIYSTGPLNEEYFELDPQKLTEKAKILTENKKWLYNNYETISKLYAHKYVAVYNKMIVDGNENLNSLIENLNTKFDNLDYILIELINPPNTKLIV